MMGALYARVDGAWILIGGAGVGVPAGGLTGQVLTKQSSTDFDTQWTTASSGSTGTVGIMLAFRAGMVA